jgi:uncharacterized protein (DUF1501 family)
MNHSRRNFLKKMGTVGAVGAGMSLVPSWMPRLAFAQDVHNPTGNTVVCIFLRGGIDGLATVAPYFEGRNYYDARPTQHLAEPGRGENPTIDLDGRFGLHPTMRPLKDIYDNGHLAFVHATGLTDPTRSHFDAMLFMEYGTPGEKFTDAGWLARHLQSTAERAGSPFRSVGLGAVLPTSLHGPVSSLALQSIADFHLQGRPDELERIRATLAQLYTINNPVQTLDHKASLVFETLEQLQSINAVNYEPANGATYPAESEFGMGMRQIAQLIKADVGLEVATIDVGGWDTHENQGTLDGTFNALLSNLTRGLAAFYHDMGDRMRNVTVVTMSEFGRTLNENASAGTDHGHGNFMMLMGGGVRGGQVFTTWPGMAPEFRDPDGDLAITTDYRDVLAEVVQHRLSNPDLDFVFPNHTPRSLGLITP